MLMAAIDECLGQKRLVVGEVNTGKTTLCHRWLVELCQRGLGQRIALIDMAPCIPHQLALAQGIAGVGGELRPPSDAGVLDLRVRLEAPRLSSKSEGEAMQKADQNGRSIDALFEKLEPGRDILFINDVTLYLQSRTAAQLIETAAFGKRTTLAVNGYLGKRLGDGELTRREKVEMNELQRWFTARGEVVPLTHCYG